MFSPHRGWVEAQKSKKEKVEMCKIFVFFSSEFDDISLGGRCAVSKEVYIDYCTVSNDVDS